MNIAVILELLIILRLMNEVNEWYQAELNRPYRQFQENLENKITKIHLHLL